MSLTDKLHRYHLILDALACLINHDVEEAMKVDKDNPELDTLTMYMNDVSELQLTFKQTYLAVALGTV